jgi:hypothetical protein
MSPWAETVKAVAWWSLELFVHLARTVAGITRTTRRVDVIIYKVDRLGDWLFAEPAIERIVRATQRKSGRCVIWASRESASLRAWRPAPCPVEMVVFEPHGAFARLRRTLAVIRLLAIYRCDTLYCLRHGPDPVRDFVLRSAAAKNVHALTWRICPGELDVVPHEVRRHLWILGGAGLAPREVTTLLPRFEVPSCAIETPAPRIVIAPFTSARIKDWTAAAWREVVDAFSDRAPAWELWVGPDQLGRARELANLLANAAKGVRRVSVHSGSLAELAAAIASARLVLSVDTMAAHIAVALDVRMVGILGGGQYGDFAPWSRGPRQRWVSHRLPCFHCGWQCTRAQNDCLQLITPAAVVAEMTALWEAVPPASSRRVRSITGTIPVPN